MEGFSIGKVTLGHQLWGVLFNGKKEERDDDEAIVESTSVTRGHFQSPCRVTHPWMENIHINSDQCRVCCVNTLLWDNAEQAGLLYQLSVFTCLLLATDT